VYIIGTAGHVDHGKTLLIKALTGIDTDRLPEEKKRGLTIDLGFAHFKGSGGTEIGVVDVPGHEKFIRNMVAGAWGIDLALLVIAADDGWMFQTENHLKVLTAMGISRIIPVITKSDASGLEKAAEVEEDACLRLLEYTGNEHPSIIVSALTGSNIPELKKLILSELELIPEPSAGKPLMFVDRAFSIKGSGLVVTGSLREGAVKKNDSLILYPAEKEIRIRAIQSYDTETETAVPACRAAFNISGADDSIVKRGCCITEKESGFSAETEFVIELDSPPDKIRNHSEVEFASGTAHCPGTIHFLKSENNKEGAPRARAVLTEALTLRYGQPVVIIRKGGSMITGSGKVIWKGPTSKTERQKIASAEDSGQKALALTVKGFVQNGDNWEFSAEMKKTAAEQIIRFAKEAGGIRFEELSGKLNLPGGALRQLMSELGNAGKITEKNGTLFAAGSGEAELPAKARQILAEMEKAGSTGLDLNTAGIPGARSELRTLVRAGLAVPLTESLFLTEKAFSKLCGSILGGLNSGDTFDISHAKETTGLSRKYIIPLLNKMEERKLVARDENLRRVI